MDDFSGELEPAEALENICEAGDVRQAFLLYTNEISGMEDHWSEKIKVTC